MSEMNEDPVQSAAHTPGPWEVVGPSQNGHCRRIFAGNEYVGIVGGSDQPMRTIRANANLVAAAPDLLDVLQEVVEDGLKTNTKEWKRKAIAAIAKAHRY